MSIHELSPPFNCMKDSNMMDSTFTAKPFTLNNAMVVT